jgi:hypothetical protein
MRVQFFSGVVVDTGELIWINKEHIVCVKPYFLDKGWVYYMSSGIRLTVTTNIFEEDP